MTQQEPLKVFELAKELGIPPISLVDRLHEIGIQVKSHMSPISVEETEKARAALAPKAVDKKKKPETAVRKRAAAKPAAAKEAAAEPAPEKKEAAPEPAAAKPAAPKPAAPVKRVVKKAAAPVEEPKETKEAKDTKEAASTVIRRRARADGETLTTTIGAPLHRPVSEGGEEATEHGHYASDASAETEPHAGASLGSEADAAEMSAEAASGAQAAGGPAVAPAIPKRKVLTIVQPDAPKIRPIIHGKDTSDTGADKNKAKDKKLGGKTAAPPRIIQVNKESLDLLVEEEAARKRGARGDRVVKTRPEDVRFADYRKKEMVFLPKKKRVHVGGQVQKTQLTTPAAHKRVVEMGDAILVQDLAGQMNVKSTDVIRKLMTMGQMVKMNQAIDTDTATLVANEYGYEVRNTAFKEQDLLQTGAQDKQEELSSRPPIVTIMGHVDHGKTSLLDAIRSANVAAGEAGGITQHIGAYTIEKDGKLITFIDTPGHEAFTLMRARGATVTDVVVLVVAADDGVMPQTREALSHAKAAKVPIVVAMNKMDMPGANPEKIKQQLAELDVLAEDWGGQTMFIPVSAKEHTNIDKLLEAILLNAEMLDLKGNPEARASGTVLEARLEKGRGPVVSVLVKRGTLRVGDPMVASEHWGKVRAMMDHAGKQVEELRPGMAAEILGLEGVPRAGEPFAVTEEDADARRIAQHRLDEARARLTSDAGKISLETFFAKAAPDQAKELKVVLKADVFGSVEAVRDSLTKLSTEKVKVNVIHAATGGVTESDVLLANASEAIIIGFNVRPETQARQIAASEGIDVRCYSIIYELLDDVKKAMGGLLDKKKVEKFLGRAEVRQTFTVPKIGTIAGSAVIDGKILRGANVRLLRDSKIVYEGKMISLKRFKDDAREVAQGYECGIGLENFNDVKPGDLIEAYEIELVQQELGA